MSWEIIKGGWWNFLLTITPINFLYSIYTIGIALWNGGARGEYSITIKYYQIQKFLLKKFGRWPIELKKHMRRMKYLEYQLINLSPAFKKLQKILNSLTILRNFHL